MMKNISICTTLIVFLLIPKIIFASTILGSYTPTIQYFKINYQPSSLFFTAPSDGILNFMIIGWTYSNQDSVSFDLFTTPDSSKSGQITITIMTSKHLCSANLVLPLNVDNKGNIETNDTSYPLKLTDCNNNSNKTINLTGTVTGDPDSTNGYTITIQ